MSPDTAPLTQDLLRPYSEKPIEDCDLDRISRPRFPTQDAVNALCGVRRLLLIPKKVQLFFFFTKSDFRDAEPTHQDPSQIRKDCECVGELVDVDHA